MISELYSANWFWGLCAEPTERDVNKETATGQELTSQERWDGRFVSSNLSTMGVFDKFEPETNELN